METTELVVFYYKHLKNEL